MSTRSLTLSLDPPVWFQSPDLLVSGPVGLLLGQG